MQNPLKTKLSAFKRKYFLHRFYRGALLFVVFGLGFWIIVSVLEYFFFLPTGFRAVLFFSLVLVELWVLVSYLLIPGYQLVRKDSVMSDEEAARLIGEFFPMIEDRLLNTLQLSGQGSNDPLLLASIQQRTNALKPFDFRKGIDFKKHYHLLFWALPVILVLAILWITGKQVILSSGTDRIVRFSEEFHPPNPFSIQILNNELEGISGQDVLVKFEILGPYRPERVALSIEGMEIPVRKDGKAYSYLFKSVTRDVDFVILTNGFANGPYHLDIFSKGELTAYQLTVSPPSYTGLPVKVYRDPGDFDFPVGSKLNWTLESRNASSLELLLPWDTLSASLADGEMAKFQAIGSSSFNYEARIANEHIREVLFHFQGHSIPDQYPRIEAEMIKDSLREGVYYFKGMANDDYGIRRLYGTLSIDGKDSLLVVDQAGSSPRSFYTTIDVSGLNDRAIEVVFTVQDNDGYHGSKSSQSQVFQLDPLNPEKVKERSNQIGQKISDQIQQLSKQMDQQNDQLQELREEKGRQRESYEERRKLEETVRDQKQLMERLQEIQKELEKKQEYDRANKSMDPELLEKQEKVKDLAKKMEDSRSQELMKRIQELMKEMNKEQASELVDQMRMENQTMMDQLEQLENLLKQLELEKALRDQIQELEEMSRDLDQMSREEMDNEESKQEDLNKRFDEWQRDQENLEQKAEEFSLEDVRDQEKEQEISEELNDAKDELNKGQQQPASEDQKSSSEKMKEMQSKMAQALSLMSAEMQKKNLEDVTQLLDNLVTLSFEQEALVDRIADSEVGSVQYGKLIREQKRLEEAFELLQDSLQTLANRTPIIEPKITRETAVIRLEIQRSIDHLTEGEVNLAQNSQRLSLTSSNDLALMLASAMDEMQQQMASKMKGDQNCQKPGSGKPGSQSNERAKQLQKQLQGKIQKFLDGKGKAPKPGKQGGSSSQGGEEIYEMIKTQEALRQALSEEKGSKENGSSESDLLDEIEKKIARGEIDQELLDRVKEIETRMLESERADREQEMKEDRESRSGERIMEDQSGSQRGVQPLGRDEKLRLKYLELNPYYQRKIRF